MESNSEFYKLDGSLHETIDLLKLELKGKQATIIDLIDIVKHFAEK